MGIPGFYGGYNGGLAGTASQPIGSGPIDAYGNVVPSTQATYVARINYNSPIGNGVPGGNGIKVYAVNPNYSPSSLGTGLSSNVASTPPAPSQQIQFDTIGQVIFRSFGNCRLPLKYIWVQGVTSSGDCSVSPTTTFAAAISAPIDPDEEGELVGIFSGDTAIYDTGGGGVIIPDGLSPEDAAALTAAINGATLYPGDEDQEPDPLIVADKGANLTNAFRGIRYIVFQNFPLSVLNGSGSGCAGSSGGPLSIQISRTNAVSSAAVEFAPGSS